MHRLALAACGNYGYLIRLKTLHFGDVDHRAFGNIHVTEIVCRCDDVEHTAACQCYFSAVGNIPFKQEEYEEAIKWAEDTLKEIREEELWFPNPDFYYCHYICNQRMCCPYKQ